MWKIFFILLIFFVSCGKTCAHPHVWIENYLEILSNEDKKINAVNVKWVYDEIYSNAVFWESDSDENKELSTAEKLKLIDKTYEELKKNDFLLLIKINNEKIKDFKIQNYNAYFKDEKLICEFKIKFTHNIDLNKNTFKISFFDKSYFIDIYFPVIESVTIPEDFIETCNYEIYEDMTESYYYDMVNPETLRLICR